MANVQTKLNLPNHILTDIVNMHNNGQNSLIISKILEQKYSSELSNLNRTNKLGSVLNIIDNSFIRPEDLEKFKLFLSRLPKHNWEFTATVESLGIGRRLMQDILNRIVVPVLEDNNLLKEE